MNALLNTCPLCQAKPGESCYNVYSFLFEPVPYTHAERNR